MIEGPLAALDAIEAATGEREANVIGYCLGGTLLAATLAYMAAQGDDRVKSATFFVTMVDFAEAGELSVFIDEEQLASLEERMKKQGYLEGAGHGDDLQHAARQRSDLVLRRQQLSARQGALPLRPVSIGTADSTRMPAAMHSFYLRNMYREQAARSRAESPSPACRSICARSRRRCFLLSTRKTTSRRGNRPMPRRSSIRAGQIRAGRLGPHRRRRQSAGQQIRPLAQRQRCRRQPGRMARRRHSS